MFCVYADVQVFTMEPVVCLSALPTLFSFMVERLDFTESLLIISVKVDCVCQCYWRFVGT